MTATNSNPSLSLTDELLTVDDLAQVFRCSRKTIQNRMSAGTLPQGFHLPGGRGSRQFWLRATVEQFVTDLASEAGALPTRKPSNAGRPTKAEQVERRR